MNIDTTKIVLGVALVGALLGTLAFFNVTPFRSIVQSVQNIVAGSPTGSTFGDAKQATVNISLASAGNNGTSTSILNNSGSDRFVNTTVIGCEGLGTSQAAYSGAGLATLTLTVGTSSTASPASTTPSMEVGALTIATSTANFILASSTAQTATSSFAAIWNAGSYMTFWVNATNTAACTVGVTYLQS